MGTGMDTHTRILLHTCCGPCATVATERLLEEVGHDVLMFFSNSNIFPESEYEKRLEHARRLAEIMGLTLETDVYDHQSWLHHIQGLEEEPEGGRRCARCFSFNFGRAALAAEKYDYPSFTTSLTVSRYKSSPQIFEQGKAFSRFVSMDFKKDGGYARSRELSRLFGLYMQNYCGCEFSRRA